jgi:hypothetical protein
MLTLTAPRQRSGRTPETKTHQVHCSCTEASNGHHVCFQLRHNTKDDVKKMEDGTQVYVFHVFTNIENANFVQNHFELHAATVPVPNVIDVIPASTRKSHKRKSSSIIHSTRGTTKQNTVEDETVLHVPSPSFPNGIVTDDARLSPIDHNLINNEVKITETSTEVTTVVPSSEEKQNGQMTSAVHGKISPTTYDSTETSLTRNPESYNAHQLIQLQNNSCDYHTEADKNLNVNEYDTDNLQQRKQRKLPINVDTNIECAEEVLLEDSLYNNCIFELSCIPHLLNPYYGFLPKNSTDFGCIGTLRLHCIRDQQFIEKLHALSVIERQQYIQSYVTKRLLNSANDNTLNTLFSKEFNDTSRKDFDVAWSITETYDPTYWSKFTADSTNDVDNYKYMKQQTTRSTDIVSSEIDWLLYDNTRPTVNKQPPVDDPSPFQVDHKHLLLRYFLDVIAKIPKPTELTKIRRMLLPITVVIYIEYQDNVRECSAPSVPACALSISLFDLWLKHTPTKQNAVKILFRISNDIPNYFGTKRHIQYPSLTYHENVFTTEVRYYYQRMQQLILESLQRCDSRFRQDDGNVNVELGISLDFSRLIVVDRFAKFITKSYVDSYTREIYDLRDNQVQMYLNGIKTEGELLDGFILKSPRTGMTLHQLLMDKKKHFDVNWTLPRFFIPTISRPRFAQLTTFRGENEKLLEQLHDLFFDNDGSLSTNVRLNVFTIPKHNFITFTPRDKRWQIPIKPSEDPQSTWQIVKTILQESGTIDTSKEEIFEIVLLIGGTVKQKNHNDVGRQQTIWDDGIKKPNEVDFKYDIAWEANRIYYNAEAADKYSPSTILIGLDPTSKTLKIGIQENQIEWTSPCKGFCRVRNGNDNENLVILEGPKNNTVTVQCTPGCRFTGDFQHCGVRNTTTENAQNINTLLTALTNFHRKYLDDNHQRRGTLAIDRLEKFSKLDTICRLHVATKSRNSKIVIPTNSVAFDDCIN